jgi:hypothetical protein
MEKKQILMCYHEYERIRDININKNKKKYNNKKRIKEAMDI